MKFLKLSILFLLFSIIINFIVVNAGVIYRRINVIEFLEGTNTTYTNYYEKNDWSNPKYEHLEMFTNLHNPCNNCKIVIKMHNDANSSSSGIMPTIGSKYVFTGGGVAQPGNYRLSMYRQDWTLLQTTMRGYWFLNEQGIDSVG